MIPTDQESPVFLIGNVAPNPFFADFSSMATRVSALFQQGPQAAVGCQFIVLNGRVDTLHKNEESIKGKDL